MYRGSFLLTMDGKGRITMPSRFRDVLQEQCGGRVVATMFFTYSIAIYPWPTWQQVEADLKTLSGSDPVHRDMLEMLLGHADERVLDSQGRLLLAPALRDYADLQREAKLMGQNEKFVVRSQENARERVEEWNRRLNDPQLTETLKRIRL